MPNNAPIGVFDSGIAGSRSSRSCSGDAGGGRHIPRRHGPRALRDQVARHGKEIRPRRVDFLVSKGIKHLVVACKHGLGGRA